MSHDYWKFGAVELAQGIRRRDYSSTDVVTSVLGRMRDKNPELNAVTVDCSDDALADAARADAAVRRGDPLGELPAGVEIIGACLRDDLILDAMEAVEARLGVVAKSLW